MFKTVYTSVFPIIQEKYADKVTFIFRQQIQPWHPSSTLVHEAGVAVLRVDQNKFWDFSSALFAQQKEFFDVSVVNETRNNTYKRLAKVAAGVGVDEKAVYELLEISDKPGKDGELNGGNRVTNDLKWMIKVSEMGANIERLGELPFHGSYVLKQSSHAQGRMEHRRAS